MYNKYSRLTEIHRQQTTNQTTIVKASKASSESSTMEASCGDPESTGMGWV
jgi:hypothetical protein